MCVCVCVCVWHLAVRTPGFSPTEQGAPLMSRGYDPRFALYFSTWAACTRTFQAFVKTWTFGPEDEFDGVADSSVRIDTRSRCLLFCESVHGDLFS